MLKIQKKLIISSCSKYDAFCLKLWLYSLLLSTYQNDMQGIWCSNTSFLWPLVVNNIKCSPEFLVTHEIITNGNKRIRWPELRRKFRTFTIRTVTVERTKKRLWNPPNGPKAGNWVSFYIGIDVIIENYTWYGWGGGGDSHMKQTGMVVVSLRGVTFWFWSRWGCSGQSANILSHAQIGLP